MKYKQLDQETIAVGDVVYDQWGIPFEVLTVGRGGISAVQRLGLDDVGKTAGDWCSCTATVPMVTLSWAHLNDWCSEDTDERI